MDELIDKIAAEITKSVLVQVRKEVNDMFAGGFEFGYLESQAAELLGCSEQTLARERRAENIDHTTNPAGRPFYMPHHIFDYLMRHEVRNGEQTVELADVLKFRRPMTQEATSETRSKAA